MAAGIIGGITTVIGLVNSLGGTGAVVEKIGAIVDRFVPDPNQKAAAALELQKLVHEEKMVAAQAATDLAKAQLASASALNMADAQSGLARRDWRSFIGWTLAGGVFYALLIQPLGTWLMTFVSAWADINFPPPPELNWTQIVALLATLLTGAGLQATQQVIARK